MEERITPEQVVEAYKTTGLKPARGDMYLNGTCACGIGVSLADETSMNQVKAWNIAYERFGHSYTWGFIRAYDGLQMKIDNDRDFIEGTEDGVTFNAHDYVCGYADGQAAWQAVVDAGLTGVTL